ncbi:MAG: KilA-N domain-containing protein [Saprospiraceae bacterium]|nr:KilA-N domain-containing protein [Lewinella sp.]
MAKKKKIIVQGHELTLLLKRDSEEYISLTDMARGFEGEPGEYIRNWLRNGSTIQYLGVWEKVHNPDFNLVEFHQIKTELIDNTFLMSAKKWIDRTSAIGIEAKAGRYGGTYAHNEIALQFATWLSPEFHVYLVKEFKRLKQIEAQEQKDSLDWSLKRMLTKINYSIHTDAIKEKLIPPRLAQGKTSGLVYAGEADILNVALFGMTAGQWRAQNPDAKGNIRDHATTEQLLVLANLEAINAELIRQRLSQDERVVRLNEAAITQMKSILNSPSRPNLPPPDKE